MTADAQALTEVDAEGLAALLAESQALVLVDYFADHCVWCARLEPVLAAAEPAYRGRVRMVKLNAARWPQALPPGGIRATPTVALFRAGRMVMSKSGMIQRGALLAFLDHWLDPANEGLSEP